MGTQFISKLSNSDVRKVRQNIRRLYTQQLPKDRSGAALSVAKLPRAAKEALADATVVQVLTIAEGHSLVAGLRESAAFVAVLDWLKKLRRDADFHGFQETIKEYELEESPSPLSGINDALTELIRKHPKDPFKTISSRTTKLLLAEVPQQPARHNEGDSESRKFGRQFAHISVKKLVDRFIFLFFSDFLAQTLSKVDPTVRSSDIKTAHDLAPDWADRLARRVSQKLQAEGTLNDSHRIRALVSEELEALVSRREASAGQVPSP